VVSAADLATVLGLARPFFGTSHTALQQRFTSTLAAAGGANGWRFTAGLQRWMVPEAVRYTELLDVWMLQPVVQTAEWLMRRAAAEDPSYWPEVPTIPSVHGWAGQILLAAS